MTHHIEVAGHLRHQIARTVAVVILHVLALDLVVQENPDAVQHVLGCPFIQESREIGQTCAEQREADHAEA
ncbi:hypothetical protein D3C84_963300 [compost metagenome]